MPLSEDRTNDPFASGPTTKNTSVIGIVPSQFTSGARVTEKATVGVGSCAEAT
jgi:hypothetical protein